MSTPVHISLSNEAWEKRLRATRHILHDIDLERKTAFCLICGQTEIHVSETCTREKPKIFCNSRYMEIRKAERQKQQSKPGRKPRHSITDINEKKLTGVCSICGPTQVWRHTTKGSTYYICTTSTRAYRRKYQRTRYVAKTAYPKAHRLSRIDEENQTALCSQCGPVAIYIWQGKRKMGRRCSNAHVIRIPGAREIRREINTDIINRFKVEKGCKACGCNSDLHQMIIYSTIGRKSPIKVGRLLTLKSSELIQKLEKWEVFCLDCR